MFEYENLDHMKIATQFDKYYFLHHIIVKRENQIFKVRLVFYAAAISSSGKSLNDMLNVGLKLQADNSDLLHRSHFYKIRLPQIFVKCIDKLKYNLTIVNTNILYVPDISEQLRDYELTTVTLAYHQKELTLSVNTV